MNVPEAGGQSRASAQDHAFEWLKEYIATLPRNEGTFLTEGDVCESTGLSRTPVREALLRLQADGFLQIVPKKGAFVPPITDAEVEAVMQARGLVEDWCVRRATSVPDSLASELMTLIDKQKVSQGNPVEFIDSDREFHRMIVHSAGNSVIANFYESLRDRQVRMGLRAIATSEYRSSQVLKEHAAIVEGISSGDPDTAATAIATHLSGTLSALQLPVISHPVSTAE